MAQTRASVVPSAATRFPLRTERRRLAPANSGQARAAAPCKLDEMRTTDLWDAHAASFQLVEPLFRDFGRVRSFAGPIATLRVFEDNALVRTALETPGQGRVLVVDGGGSVRRALVGGNLGKLAEQNGWSGIVVHGAVRDTVELAQSDVGIKAITAIPAKSEKKGAGERDVEVTFGSCSFRPGEYLYADEDGILVSRERHGI